ncbi:hypothetical protein D3C72_377510 [compost metagenome]
MAKAYSYVRFSSAGQGDGDSERRQDARSVAYAATHNLDLVQSYKDLGVSGWKGKNHTEGALSKFLEAVAAGAIEKGSFLLVEAFDRLTREQVPDALELFLRITNSGITIVTLFDGNFWSRENITQDWTKLIIALVAFATANTDVRLKSERLTDSWEERRANIANARATTVCPAWLKPADGPTGFVEIKHRADLVRRIFHEIADLGMGKTKIALRLNAEKIDAWGPDKKSGKKTSWHGSYIQKLVEGRLVLGEYQPHRINKVTGKREPDGPAIPNYYFQTIDPELYHRAQAAMRSRRNGSSGRKGETYSNLLSGLAHCDECSGSMVYLNKGPAPKGGQYLVCTNARRRFRCTATTHHPYQIIEDRFLKLVGFDLELTGDAPDDSRLRAQIAEAKHALAAVIHRIDRLEEEILDRPDGTKPSPTLRTKVLTAERNRDDLQASIKTLENELNDLRSKSAPNSHQEAIRAFLGQMETSTDLYAMRSRLAASVKAIVDDLVVEASGVVTIIILGGTKVIRWDEAGWHMIDMTGRVAAGLVPDAFTGGDADRMRQLRRIAR